MCKIQKCFFLLAIALNVLEFSVNVLAASCLTQDVVESSSGKCDNHLAIVYQLMKDVRLCKTSLNDKEFELSSIIKTYDEQLAMYNSTIMAQKSSITFEMSKSEIKAYISKQLEPYQLKIASQEVSIKKISEQLAKNKKQLKECESQIEDQKSSIKNITEQFVALKGQLDIMSCSNAHANNETSALAPNFVPIGNSSGIQTILPPVMEFFSVSHDLRFADPGWTVIMSRMDGSVNFNRDWQEYKHGFGNSSGEFWIGLENIHRMTASQPHELYIYIENPKSIRYLQYDAFMIGNEEEEYYLKSLGRYSGSFWNALERHEKMNFSTYDRGHRITCAKYYSGGWWFEIPRCASWIVTQPYVTDNEDEHFGLIWHLQQDIKFIQMMVRPRNFEKIFK